MLSARAGVSLRITAEAFDAPRQGLGAGSRAHVFGVRAGCEVTAVRVMCDGMDPAAAARLYRIGLDEGHRFEAWRAGTSFSAAGSAGSAAAPAAPAGSAAGVGGA